MEFIKTITDAFQSLAKNFNDRIKSPIGGAFFFSWLIFNWKLVYYILMQTEIPSKKIEYVETYFLNIYPVLVYPAMASIAYVLFYPIIYNVSNLAWTFIDKNLKTLVAVQIEKKVLLTTEDRQQLYALMRDQSVKHEEEIERLRGQIEALSKLTTQFETEDETDEPPQNETVNESQEQPKEPTNQNNDDAEFKAKLTSPIGKNGLTILIKEMMGIDDNSLDKNRDLSDYHLLIRAIFLSEPESISTQELLSRVKNMDYVRLEDLLMTLDEHNIVYMNTTTGKYTLTNGTISKIYLMLNRL